jgi:predicted P-loop ATPase
MSAPPTTDALVAEGSSTNWGNSYASCVRAARDTRVRGVLLGRGALEFDEMALAATLARSPLTDADLGRFRERAELRLRTPPTQAAPKGRSIQFSPGDVMAAVHQVAHEHPFHAVRDYLLRLHPKKPGAILALCEVIGVRRDLEREYVWRFLISAVARAMKPGCKVDSVLILVGKQGLCKSSLLRALAGDEWFCDSPMDLSSKDGLMLLRRAWIYEWPELEAMLHARDRGSVKAFLARQEDSYRPPYGRLVETFPRTSVIVGTTNDSDFLTDPSGSRRFWPIPIRARVDLNAARLLRDAVWSEALAAYRAGEHWWLDAKAEQARARTNRRYERGDAWEPVVLGWAQEQPGSFTLADILQVPLAKPKGQWNRADEMRIADILRSNGYVRGKRGSGIAQPGQRGRLWGRPEKRARNQVDVRPGQPDQPILETHWEGSPCGR